MTKLGKFLTLRSDENLGDIFHFVNLMRFLVSRKIEYFDGERLILSFCQQIKSMIICPVLQR